MKLACCVLASVLLLVSPGILASPEDGAELMLYEVLRGMDAPIRTIHNQVMDSDQVEAQFQELVTRGQGGDTDALIAAACLTSNIWFAEQAGAKGRSTAQDARAFELMAEAADRGSATALTYLAVYLGDYLAMPFEDLRYAQFVDGCFWGYRYSGMTRVPKARLIKTKCKFAPEKKLS